MQFYVYVLLSNQDNNFYIGYTKNLKRRIEEHQNGSVQSTKNRLPMMLVYYETCLDNNDAIKRERYLKSGMGKRFLKNRIKNYLRGINIK
ncbi:GIY-YIG nuclease family protein [Patescibacteria group bacterium]